MKRIFCFDGFFIAVILKSKIQERIVGPARNEE